MTQSARLITAASISTALEQVKVGKDFSRVAADVKKILAGLPISRVAVDRDENWKRVHASIADILKEASMLYSKLARLEADFAGEELESLERVSEAVLAIGDELSRFSKAFYEGKYTAQESEFTYGGEGNENGGGGESELPAIDFPTAAGDDDTGADVGDDGPATFEVEDFDETQEPSEQGKQEQDKED